MSHAFPCCGMGLLIRMSDACFRACVPPARCPADLVVAVTRETSLEILVSVAESDCPVVHIFGRADDQPFHVFTVVELSGLKLLTTVYVYVQTVNVQITKLMRQPCFTNRTSTGHLT